MMVAATTVDGVAMVSASVARIPLSPTDSVLGSAGKLVTGLLGGHEVLSALREQPLAGGEWLLAPRTFAPAALGRTLDDVSEAELSAACDGRLALGDDLAAAVAAVTP